MLENLIIEKKASHGHELDSDSVTIAAIALHQCATVIVVIGAIVSCLFLPSWLVSFESVKKIWKGCAWLRA